MLCLPSSRLLVVLLLLLLLTAPSSVKASSSSSSHNPHYNNKASDVVDIVKQQHDHHYKNVVIGVDGGTESIRACCFDAANGRPLSRVCAIPVTTNHPKPGWAEQDPAEWYRALGEAVRGAVSSCMQSSMSSTTDDEDDAEQEQQQQHFKWVAMCVDTTCCSVVAMDDSNQPLRPSLLWMDVRSASQAEEILSKCLGDPALDVNCGGKGPLSAEWMTPKCLWIKQNEPDVWEKAKVICEYQDYINYKLTGIMCASSCNAASRWHWDGEECLRSSNEPQDRGERGRPLSMYKTLEIPELADKLPQQCLPMGATIGGLTSDAAKHLNLPEGLPVAQGGPDAFVGMIGLGCIHPGQLCLITGSSHLHCVVSAQATTAPGTWGAYRGAPLVGLNFAEGGQSSTGSILRWAKNSLFGNNGDLDYKQLDDEASAVPPGCDGLVACETFQGSRTPVTDPLARGALVGLTLAHTRGHIWRAFMEAVCYGTRACLEGLERAGHNCQEIVIAGGATRSPLWLQMHADVTGKRVIVCENADAPLLGCAILASVGPGIHHSVDDAVKAMVRTARIVEPNDETEVLYTNMYDHVYRHVGSAVRPIVHAIASLRGGNHDEVVISPSLLASDWSNIRGEIQRCLDAGMSHLHVDVFDGVFLDSPFALTFGPQMVKAIRKCCNELKSSDGKAVLDLHVCVDRPARYVEAMAASGGTRFIFQWEAMEGKDDGARLASAIDLATKIKEAGLKCGISINPSTEVEIILPLVDTGLVDLVDVLAVEPGFGGQSFQRLVLSKIKVLVEWRDNRGANLKVLVDGGVNSDTAPLIVAAGADILVAGTFLFSHSKGLKSGVDELTATISKCL